MRAGTEACACAADQRVLFPLVKIVLDQNIPYAREAFASLGEVRALDGRKIGPGEARDADVLILRSVTTVNAALLRDSRVRFVGTCTIGTDHVDVEALQRLGVAFASAPGSNANSVAEYVVAALLVLARRSGIRLRGRTLGVVGAGNVGNRVARKAAALGLRVILHDPPLRRRTGDDLYRPLDEIFGADFVTLHVPLTDSGPDATRRMVDTRFLGALRRGAALINTSRGPVVDETALADALERGRLAAAVLDVWENEPRIDPTLLARAALATPHIAGYSLDGKAGGTLAVHHALCAFLGRDASWDPAPLLPPPRRARIRLSLAGREPEDAVGEAVHALYDIECDDGALRQALALGPDARAAHFDRLRRDYPIRREFPSAIVSLDTSPGARGGMDDRESTRAHAELASTLEGLGFVLAWSTGADRGPTS